MGPMLQPSEKCLLARSRSEYSVVAERDRAREREREVGGLLEHAVVRLQVFLVPLMSSSHVDRVIELLSLSMEPMEMVAGSEQPIFIAMKRKSGEELDLVCESGGKQNMKWDFCEVVQGV